MGPVTLQLGLMLTAYVIMQVSFVNNLSCSKPTLKEIEANSDSDSDVFISRYGQSDSEESTVTQGRAEHFLKKKTVKRAF